MAHFDSFRSKTKIDFASIFSSSKDMLNGIFMRTLKPVLHVKFEFD